MKNYFILFVSLFLILSCNKQDSTVLPDNQKSLTCLSSDNNFKNLVKEVTNFNERVALNDKRENKLILDEFDNNRLKNAEDAIAENFQVDVNKQLELANYIIASYDVNKYSESELNSIILKAMSEVDQQSIQSRVEDRDRCYRRYRNRIIEIGAIVVGGHIACGAADLTVVLGGFCHGAVIAGQIAASDNAYLDYQDCLEKQ